MSLLVRQNLFISDRMNGTLHVCRALRCCSTSPPVLLWQHIYSWGIRLRAFSAWLAFARIKSVQMSPYSAAVTAGHHSFRVYNHNIYVAPLPTTIHCLMFCCTQWRLPKGLERHEYQKLHVAQVQIRMESTHPLDNVPINTQKYFAEYNMFYVCEYVLWGFFI